MDEAFIAPHAELAERLRIAGVYPGCPERQDALAARLHADGLDADGLRLLVEYAVAGSDGDDNAAARRLVARLNHVDQWRGTVTDLRARRALYREARGELTDRTDRDAEDAERERRAPHRHARRYGGAACAVSTRSWASLMLSPSNVSTDWPALIAPTHSRRSAGSTVSPPSSLSSCLAKRARERTT